MADQLFFSFLKLNISNFCEMISLSCVAFISCKISRNWKMTVDDLQMTIDCHLYFPLFFLLFAFLSVTSHVSIFHIGFLMFSFFYFRDLMISCVFISGFICPTAPISEPFFLIHFFLKVLPTSS